MSIIKQKLPFRGSKQKQELVAMFDSGASDSCIDAELAKDLGDFIPLESPIMAMSADKTHKIEIKGYISLNFQLGGVTTLMDTFMVIPNLSEQIIIGAATMQKYRLKLDFEHDTVIVDPKVGKLQIV